MKDGYPKFAVVGHPNKGKSSIVATLAHDESVHISNVPGATTIQRSYPLQIDGVTLYELYDTPGFQRARAILAWLKEEEVPAHQRVNRIKRFMYEHRDNPKFHDEIELLKPILDGAGIIYIVDGSKPYGVEYEAEMQILEWTGQPSMALVNLIGDTDYIEEWNLALRHYFQMVRVFNPMKANFEKHLKILDSIAQLKEEWIEPIKESIEVFKDYHSKKIENSALIITQLIINSLSFVVSLPIDDISKVDSNKKDKQLTKYKTQLRKLETNSHKKISKVWNHLLIEKDINNHIFEEMDLFSQQSETIFGLNKKELLWSGVAGGALTGSSIDLMFVGSTFMLGSAVGAVVGGAGVVFGYGEVAKIEVLGQKLGKKSLEIGPMQNLNFPYILLQRALYYTNEMANKPHANKDKVTISNMMENNKIDISSEDRKILDKIHQIARKGQVVKSKEFNLYLNVITSILEKSIK